MRRIAVTFIALLAVVGVAACGSSTSSRTTIASASSHPLANGGAPNLQRLHIAIASLEDIIRSKTAAGRAKDLATLPQLRAAPRAPAWQGRQTGRHQRVTTVS